jgi:CubicO group peptidase (beta-lactamase class C family)
VPAGFTKAGLNRFHDLAASHVGPTQVPGLVALVARSDTVHVEALGEMTIGGPPIGRDAVFRIASTTKPITAAATLALVHEGLLALDEPVGRLLPELADPVVLARPDGALDDTHPAARPITVRDLLTFTFGFGMALDMFLGSAPWPIVTAMAAKRLAAFGPPDPTIPHTPDTWIAALGSLPLVAQPGERWLYNTGTQVLGVLLSRAAGMPFDDVVRTRITEPLGMSDTAFWAADATRLPTEYRLAPDGLIVHDPPQGAWATRPSFPDGSAGLASTVDDLLAFARMLLAGGGTVLPPELVRAMTSDQLTEAQRSHGGLGPGFFDTRSWGFGQAVYPDGSYGWDGGFGSTWRVDPRRDLVTIILAQRMWETSSPPALHRDLLAAAVAAIE